MNRQTLISEIERRATGRLSEVEIHDLLIETQNHLDASYQGHVSLGSPPEEAERFAAESFGNAKSFLRPILRRRSRQMNRAAFVVSLVTVLSIACSVVLESHQNALEVILFWCVPVVCCGIVGALSYRATGFAWKGLLGAFILSIPLLACLSATAVISTARYDFTSKSSYERNIQQANFEIPRAQEDLAQFQALARTAQTGLTAATGPYRVPIRLERGGYIQKSILAREAAAKLLATETARTQAYYLDDISGLTAYRVEARQRLATPFLSNVKRLIPFSSMAALFILGGLSVSALFGVIPALIRRAILTSRRKVTA